jgi:hypothetical protein
VSPQDAPEDDAFVRTAIRGMRPPDHHPEFWDGLAARIDGAEDERRMDVAIGPPGSLDDVAPRARSGRRAAPRAPERPARRAAPLRAAPVAQVAAAAAAMDAMDPAAPGPPTEVLPLPQHLPQAAAPAPQTAEADEDPFGPIVDHADGKERDLEPDAPTAPRHAARPPAAPGHRGLPAHDAPREQVFIPAAAAATTAAALAGRGVRGVADPLAKLTVRHDPATMPRSMRRTSNAVLLGLAVLALVVALVAGLSLVRQRSDSSAPPAPATSADQPVEEPAT